MLLLANFANTKKCENPRKFTETLANGYSSERTRQELSNEYQDDRVSMVFQESCILVLKTKVVSALEGLRSITIKHISLFTRVESCCKTGFVFCVYNCTQELPPI